MYAALMTHSVTRSKVRDVPREPLRKLALECLPRMYRADERLFVFRVRSAGDRVVAEGLSPRYTAITLLGLAREEDDAVDAILAGHEPRQVCDRLIDHVERTGSLGDAALILWALALYKHPRRKEVERRVDALFSRGAAHATVEAAWALSAFCHVPSSPRADSLRDVLAGYLLESFGESHLFPHRLGGAGGLRGHVSCFADLVYPIQALSLYYMRTGNPRALDAAERCAAHTCATQGPAGQWWWHHDYRTGRVLERYPVYAVHQDAMAPMALFAVAEAGGNDYRNAIETGMAWLRAAPELNGGSLIDEQAGVIWRKVARREPHKLTRRLSALSSRIHPGLQGPRLDRLFPPREIDFECRPYHLGWLLYAWPAGTSSRRPDIEEAMR